MLNIANVPEHIRDWFEKDLLPEITELRDAAKAQAQQVLNAAQRELERVQAEGPSLGDKAQAFITAAENAVADAEALLAKFGPIGM